MYFFLSRRARFSLDDPFGDPGAWEMHVTCLRPVDCGREEVRATETHLADGGPKLLHLRDTARDSRQVSGWKTVHSGHLS